MPRIINSFSIAGNKILFIDNRLMGFQASSVQWYAFKYIDKYLMLEGLNSRHCQFKQVYKSLKSCSLFSFGDKISGDLSQYCVAISQKSVIFYIYRCSCKLSRRDSIWFHQSGKCNFLLVFGIKNQRVIIK